MKTLDLEATIAEFLKNGQRIQTTQPLTGEQILEELTTWYATSRITGADASDDNDMLLLQWGGQEPINLLKPTDLRNISDKSIIFNGPELQYLDFTRQVFADSDENDAEFDDSAVKMSITLYYDASNGNELDSNLWIHNPDEIESGKKEFRSKPYVSTLLTASVQRVTVTVDRCG